MTYAAQINSTYQACHGPEGGAGNQPLVGVVVSSKMGEPYERTIFHFSLTEYLQSLPLPKRRRWDGVRELTSKSLQMENEKWKMICGEHRTHRLTGSLAQVHQPALQGGGGGLGSVRHSELAEDIIDVTLHGSFADA